MEVKRVKMDSRFFTYEVESCKHVRIAPPYTSDRTSSWSIRIPDIAPGAIRSVSIYSSKTLAGIKEVLTRFQTEEELLGAYYKARIEGRYHLY